MHFNSLAKFRKAAKANGLRTRLVAHSKTNDYYQAVHKVAGIVGYFQTGYLFGLINFNQVHPPIPPDPADIADPMDREIILSHLMEDCCLRKPATTADDDVLDVIRHLSGADEGGDGQGFTLKSEIQAAMPGIDIGTALRRLEQSGKILHSVYGYHIPTRRKS